MFNTRGVRILKSTLLELAVAAAEITTVEPSWIPTTVAFAGIPAPAIGAPTEIPDVSPTFTNVDPKINVPARYVAPAPNPELPPIILT
jgi:hypothetical protein